MTTADTRPPATYEVVVHPSGLPVRENSTIKLGHVVLIGDDEIAMHPLDVNALRYPNPFDRLRALERWAADELRRRIR
ncbi:hypothetical protein [Curtobacterium sp. MCBA15_004]|uniref:hypothetical protein n=1 Tax=Curtobacterium sp. MCBA15_004 TaxID=1898733 RepID=UPI000A7D48D8|nr:hypothetical protein [Curtobacterium sp. MCBA15_004]WIA97638.1 hypothetical protein QOL16_04385 [Curtobacterium sp. MCBA15_004]